MKHSIIDSRIEYGQDIPSSIESGLLSLFGVESLVQLSAAEKESIKNSVQILFRTTGATDYDGFCKAYALYYLPVNFYKIWRPLLDLVLTDCLPARGRILELGAGPGSATFGVIEFFKYLAIENSTRSFCLDIALVEKNVDFITIFEKLYSAYARSLPDNLVVSVKCINDDAFAYLSQEKGSCYDLIIESNMLNPNESIMESRLSEFAVGLNRHMAKHASAILIEPAKKELTKTLRATKKQLLSVRLNCYSPCCCNNTECFQFASGRVNAEGIRLTQQLFDKGIITRQQKTHAFEYAVFRNDRMSKHEYDGSGNVLSKLENRAGEVIRFKAFILTTVDSGDHFSIKICDGSRPCSGDLLFEVPKSILVEKQLNCLTAGRGGLVDVKDAVVVNSTIIGVTQKTRLKIYM